MRIRATAMIPYNDPRLIPLMKFGADIPKKNCTTSTKAKATMIARAAFASGELDRSAVCSAFGRAAGSGSGGGGGASGARVAVTEPVLRELPGNRWVVHLGVLPEIEPRALDGDV